MNHSSLVGRQTGRGVYFAAALPASPSTADGSAGVLKISVLMSSQSFTFRMGVVFEALAHDWVKCACPRQSQQESDEESDESDLAQDELEDEGGPPPGCMSKRERRCAKEQQGTFCNMANYRPKEGANTSKLLELDGSRTSESGQALECILQPTGRL